jgi:hypothetical protein
MQLSKNTVEILKNFATINQGILFKTGNEIKTTSIMKHIFAKAKVEEEFPLDFAIYDLPEFLNTLTLFDQSPNLEFEENKVVIEYGNNRINYFYSSPNVVIAPPNKKIELPSKDLSFVLSQKQLSQLQKASNIMKLKDMVMTAKGIILMNKEVGGNQFEMLIDTVTDNDDCEYVVKMENLKLIPNNYEVCVSSQGVVQFKSPENELEYFILLQSND